jgi:glycosyltransferase involved in cell wall biosynthesis
MRIALVAHSNAPWTPHYARFFLAEGHAVCVISFHPQPIEGVDFRYFGATPFRDGGGKSFMMRRVPAIRAFLRAWSPDVVFAPYLISNGLTAALANVAPLVASARGGDIQMQAGATPIPQILRRAIVRFVCVRSRRVHAVSAGLVDALAAIGVVRDKIECFPIGVDLRRFSLPPELHPETAEPLLICTRRHEPVYRNQDIVEALALLKSRGRSVRCLFVGGGSLLEERRRQASSLGLDDIVRFTAQLPHDEMPARLRQASIYISASTSDGTSSSLLEAMASGLFPVVSRITANEEWLREGETALMFAVGESAALAGALERALDDPLLRKRAAMGNRRMVEQRGNLAINNRRLLELLRSAAGSDARRDQR